MGLSDGFTYHSGETEPRQFAVDSATVIEIGDALFFDTDDVKPAGDLTFLSNLVITQEDFHDKFAGIALQRSDALDTANIRVATKGIFRMASPSATYEVGDLVGMNDNVGGTALENQEVIAAATENLAVGRVTRREATAATAVLVAIESTTAQGGPQAPA